MNWFSATSTVLACCELFSVASNGQVYSKCAVQRTVNALAFCDFIKWSARRHRQKYKHELEQPRVKWTSPEWNGSVICMTSANVKFGAKIDSRALNSPHRRTLLASFVLPLTLSSKFAFSRFYFPQLMFYILTEARIFSPNVLNLAVWGWFWYKRADAKLYALWKSGIRRRSPNAKRLCHTYPFHVVINS